jgi:hypothetical protein
LVRNEVIRVGKSGAMKVAFKADCSPRMVYNVIEGHIPGQVTAYRLALACGCSEEDALKIAKECSSERAKETA